MEVCRQKCKTCTLLCCGAALITLGLLVGLFWGVLYDTIVKKELSLSSTSLSYKFWKETPIPIYLSVHLFNWTNSDEVLKSEWSVKPEFQECGPYVFLEKHIRVNVTWNENGTVTFQQKKIWHFEPSKSKGSLNDRITNFNPIVATVGNMVKNWNFLIRKGVDFILNEYEHGLILTASVDELLFKGYDDGLIDIISKLNISGLNIPIDKFGWFYSRNDSVSYDGVFTMYTGESDIDLLGLMDLWNGKSFTDAYESYCALINGTTGELWPPIKNYNQVSMFVPDLCSSLSLQYFEDKRVNSVNGRKYIGSDYIFDNGTKYPEQACFQGNEVVPSGTRSISACKFGAPVFISYPHFYLADSSYRNTITGMHPNKTEHETYIIFEPKTGIPLEARAQLQVNFFVESIPSILLFDNVKPTYIPMLWVREEAILPEEYCILIKIMLILSNANLGWLVLGIGIALTIIGEYIHFRNDWKDLEAEQLLLEDQ